MKIAPEASPRLPAGTNYPDCKTPRQQQLLTGHSLVWDQIVEKRSLADVFLVHTDSFHFFDTMDMYAGKKEVLDHRFCCVH